MMNKKINSMTEVNEMESYVIEGGNPIAIFGAFIWIGLEIGDRIWGMITQGTGGPRKARG